MFLNPIQYYFNTVAVLFINYSFSVSTICERHSQFSPLEHSEQNIAKIYLMIDTNSILLPKNVLKKALLHFLDMAMCKYLSYNSTFFIDIERSFS